MILPPLVFPAGAFPTMLAPSITRKHYTRQESLARDRSSPEEKKVLQHFERHHRYLHFAKQARVFTRPRASPFVLVLAQPRQYLIDIMEGLSFSHFIVVMVEKLAKLL